ncbi:MAG: phosphoribosyl-AMP cyclohydrolase [Ardenticatenaceae bacterium]|nr:phosphoribosyl-AMP cyclohydrolase [Ardenticatenaceae bacterium]
MRSLHLRGELNKVLNHMQNLNNQHPSFLEDLQFNQQGLIPAIVQDSVTRQVLMMAWMNRDSLALTLEQGETVFWSRSRQEIWHKGATSGNVQRVQEMYYDCDGDTLLIVVEPAGPACHTGEVSCFFRKLN